MLYFSNNCLIDSGVVYLSDVFEYGNCKFKMLYVSNNYLFDSEVEYLSDGFEYGNCKFVLLYLVIIV